MSAKDERKAKRHKNRRRKRRTSCCRQRQAASSTNASDSDSGYFHHLSSSRENNGRNKHRDRRFAGSLEDRPTRKGPGLKTRNKSRSRRSSNACNSGAPSHGTGAGSDSKSGSSFENLAHGLQGIELDEGDGFESSSSSVSLTALQAHEEYGLGYFNFYELHSLDHSRIYGESLSEGTSDASSSERGDGGHVNGDGDHLQTHHISGAGDRGEKQSQDSGSEDTAGCEASTGEAQVSNHDGGNVNDPIFSSVFLVQQIKDDLLLNWLPDAESDEFTLPAIFDNRTREKFHQIARLLQCRSKSTGPKSLRTLTIRRTRSTPSCLEALPRYASIVISSLFARIFKLECQKAASASGTRLSPDPSSRSARPRSGRRRDGRKFRSKSSRSCRAGRMSRYEAFDGDEESVLPGNDRPSGPSSKPGAVSAKIKPGHVVGGSAPPIEESNIGNQLLRKLGWTPGSAIGRGDVQTGGGQEPIHVIVRKKNSGLGS